MTGMTLTEKVLARASAADRVTAGQEIWADADRIIMNDSSGPRRIEPVVAELGGVADPSRLVVVSDHFVPAANTRHAQILKTTRRWSREQNVGAFHEYDGILHSLVLERRLVRPGMLLVGADSHTPMAGAVGAVAVPVGSTELATVVATNRVWLRVPDTIRIDLAGTLPPRVTIRDLTMHILRDLGVGFAEYTAIEYGGPAIEQLTLDARGVLSNQGAEMGAKNAIVVPTPKLEALFDDLGDAEVLHPDPDAHYAARHRYDLSTLAPLVAAHPSPANVYSIGELAGTSVEMAWIGSCAGGQRSDLVAAAELLRGQNASVPLLVTPATRKVMEQCLRDGTLEALTEAGATIMPPGCGACAGLHAGVQGPGDRVIATATRNFPGRMGSRESEVHLGSPFTVAASAITGRITDPRELT